MTRFTPDEILEEAQDNALIESRSRGGLRLEQDISLDGFPGRYLVADSALRDSVRGIYDGAYKARIYLVGNRLYRVTTYVFNENWNNRLQTMDDYLASFELLSRNIKGEHCFVSTRLLGAAFSFSSASSAA
jgi:hypothetical protein